jgi:hypothetical protein
MGWTGPALVLGTYIVGTIINYFWPSHHAWISFPQRDRLVALSYFPKISVKWLPFRSSLGPAMRHRTTRQLWMIIMIIVLIIYQHPLTRVNHNSPSPSETFQRKFQNLRTVHFFSQTHVWKFLLTLCCHRDRTISSLFWN